MKTSTNIHANFVSLLSSAHRIINITFYITKKKYDICSSIGFILERGDSYYVKNPLIFMKGGYLSVIISSVIISGRIGFSNAL
jgi:hypothetical protein